MKSYIKFIIFAIFTVAATSGCSKKNGGSDQSASATPPPVVENSGPLVLTATFQVPEKYSNYIRQEVTEATDSEFDKLPDSALDNFDNIWIKQAASIANPDWQTLAALLHPQVITETNVFKQQEVADKVKTEIQIDKNSLNVVFGMQGKVMDLGKPDATTGEYHLFIYPNEAVSFTYAKKTLSYKSDFGCNSCNHIMMVVKVPIEKSKEIEALRENKHKDFVRIYGHVTGNYEKSGYSSNAGLTVDVEAIEIGSRQNGQYKSYFFLDNDQVRRWVSLNKRH